MLKLGILFLLLKAASCFNQGILFEGGRDVLLTDSHWRISLQYNLTDLERHSYNLSSLMVEVKVYLNTFFENLKVDNISVHSPLINLEAGFRFEYAVVQQEVLAYVDKVSDLVTLLPKWRGRRGLLDAGGHALKFLFGTMDSDDLRIIDGKLSHLYQSEEEIVHRSEEQVTILANMQVAVTNNAKAINRVIGNLKEWHSNIHKNMVKLFRDDQINRVQIRTLLEYQKLNLILADVKDTVTSATARINTFHEAIEQLAAGRLSSTFLPPHDFLHILRSVEKVVPPPNKLHLPISMENLHEYYATAVVHSYATAHTLRVVVQLPLKSEDKLFQMYSVHVYPVYDNSLNRWAQWDIQPQKLLISKDRLTYTMYEENLFNKECLVGQQIVCPLAEVLLSVKNRPNCVVELFLGKLSRLCSRKLITGIKSPAIVKTPSHWLYSTSSSHKVTLNCYGSNVETLNVSVKTIQHVGVLSEINKCDIITDDFKLPARIHGSSRFSIPESKIIFPDIAEMFTSREKGMLGYDIDDTLEVLQGLDEELGNVEVKEHLLENVVIKLEERRILYNRIFYIVLAVLSCVSLMLVYVCCRARKAVSAWCRIHWTCCRARRDAMLTGVRGRAPEAAETQNPDVDIEMNQTAAGQSDETSPQP